MPWNPEDTLPPEPPTPINPDLYPTRTVVLAWSKREPHRRGEVTFFSPDDSTIVGPRKDDDPPSALFSRQRLGPGLESPAPLVYTADEAETMARVRVDREDMLVIEQLGDAGTVRVNGEPTRFAELKPGDTFALDDENLFVCVLRARQMDHYRRIHAPYFAEPDAAGFLGESPAAWAHRHNLAWATTEARDHVLVSGEPGTGHVAAAEFLHHGSRRSAGPLRSADASATLLRDEAFVPLFGNVQNYPRSNLAPSEGLLGEAEHGTLVLHGLQAVPLASQAALDEVLDSGDYTPLGGTRRHADVRIIASMTGPMSAIEGATFWRFTHRITLPPLRDRPEDIPLLVHHHLKKRAAASPELKARFCDETPQGTPVPRVTLALIDHLVRHPLPGNLDQLAALLDQALATSPGRDVDLTAAVRKATWGATLHPLPQATAAG